MADMVETVARAIYEEGKPDHEPPWPGRHPKAFHSAARAAIEAMREPMREMLRRGDVYVNGYEDMRSVYDCWQAMIDAALSEPREAGR